MAQRGRKTDTKQRQKVSGITAATKPKPPADLTKEEAQEWDNIVGALRADFFGPETHALLAHYCRRLVLDRFYGAQLRKKMQSDEVDLTEFTRLMKIQRDEGAALTSLATKLRITPQSTYHPEKVKADKVKPSWVA